MQCPECGEYKVVVLKKKSRSTDEYYLECPKHGCWQIKVRQVDE